VVVLTRDRQDPALVLHGEFGITEATPPVKRDRSAGDFGVDTGPEYPGE
jgi:hypothetical protein